MLRALRGEALAEMADHLRRWEVSARFPQHLDITQYAMLANSTPPPYAERAEYLLIKTIRDVKQEDSGDEVASPHLVATPQPNRRNATASWHHLPSKVWLLKSPIYNSQATVHLERLEPYGQNRVTYGFEDQGSDVKLVLKLGAHGDEVGLSRTYSGFCASVVWHGTFRVRWATHLESTASVSLIPAILQERVELATTFLELQGVDSKGSVEFLTYSTVVLAILRATGVELMDTGASNLGINSAAVPQPKLQLFDFGSWYLVRPVHEMDRVQGPPRQVCPCQIGLDKDSPSS